MMEALLAFLLPPGMEWPTLLGLWGASFVTSFITVTFGLGGGVALLGILASLLPPAALIPVHGMIQFGSNGLRALIMARQAVWPVVLSFLAGSIVGVAIGGILVVELPGSIVQIGVAGFIVWSVFAKPPAFMSKAASASGAFSSFLTMFFGATGPFVAAYLKTLSLSRLEHVGTYALCMAIQHLLKCVAFGFLGFSFGPFMGFIGVMIATGFLGTLAGRHVLLKLDEELFGKILNAIMLLLAARLFWLGVMSL